MLFHICSIKSNWKYQDVLYVILYTFPCDSGEHTVFSFLGRQDKYLLKRLKKSVYMCVHTCACLCVWVCHSCICVILAVHVCHAQQKKKKETGLTFGSEWHLDRIFTAGELVNHLNLNVSHLIPAGSQKLAPIDSLKCPEGESKEEQVQGGARQRAGPIEHYCCWLTLFRTVCWFDVVCTGLSVRKMECVCDRG